MNVSEHVIVTCYSNRLFVSWKEYLMFPVCTTDPMLVAAESFQEELAGQSVTAGQFEKGRWAA